MCVKIKFMQRLEKQENIYPVISQYQHLIEMNFFLKKYCLFCPGKMERRSRKRCSSNASEKMESIGDR